MSSAENYIWVIAIVVGLGIRLFTFLRKHSKQSPQGFKLPKPVVRRPVQRAPQRPGAHPRIFQSNGPPPAGRTAATVSRTQASSGSGGPGASPDMAKLLKELGIELPPQVAAKLQASAPARLAPAPARLAPAPAARPSAAAAARAPAQGPRVPPPRVPAVAAAARPVGILREGRTVARPRLDLRADPTLLRDAIILQSVLGRRS